MLPVNHPSSIPAQHARHHAAIATQRADLRKDLFCLSLDLIGECLNEPRATERIDDIGQPGLFEQHLLRTQCNRRRALAR